MPKANHFLVELFLAVVIEVVSNFLILLQFKNISLNSFSVIKSVSVKIPDNLASSSNEIIDFNDMGLVEVKKEHMLINLIM